MASKLNGLAKYPKASSAPKHRLIWAGFGEVGTGKTTFGLGAPGPIAVISFDKGLEGVVEPFTEQKDIHVLEYDWSPTAELDQDEAIALRDQVTADFEYVIQHARTVILDRETDIWELFRYAEFGAPNDSPRNYPALNQRYRRLINMPKALDINFGCVQGMKSEWAAKVNAKTGAQGAAATGARIRAGFGELDGLVHLNIEHYRENGEFGMRVGKARGPGGADVQDKELPGLSFAEFAQLVFPGTDESDWV